MLSSFATDGFAVVEAAMDNAVLAEMIGLTNSLPTGNVRNLLRDYGAMRAFAGSPRNMCLARNLLGPGARAVKATLFDKTPESNWKVPPHQDLTIAVRERVETAGFHSWSIKAGIHNVQPPSEILTGMVAFRFHLDDCDETNGALKIWPGSHRYGRLGDSGIADWISTHEVVICPVPAGGLNLMRPLTIHASSSAVSPRHRRVIHIEYAAGPLPNELQWLDEITD